MIALAFHRNHAAVLQIGDRLNHDHAIRFLVVPPFDITVQVPGAILQDLDDQMLISHGAVIGVNRDDPLL